MADMRYMCLSCGCFYIAEVGRNCAGTDQCPKCKDTFFVDNCIENVPPILEDERKWQEERLTQLGI